MHWKMYDKNMTNLQSLLVIRWGNWYPSRIWSIEVFVFTLANEILDENINKTLQIDELYCELRQFKVNKCTSIHPFFLYASRTHSAASWELKSRWQGSATKLGLSLVWAMFKISKQEISWFCYCSTLKSNFQNDILDKE